MLIQALLIFGLAAVPFLLIPGHDTREPKMMLALAVALVTGLAAVFQGRLRPFHNKWVLILLGYLLVSIWFAPTLITPKVPNLWVWQPAFAMLVFALFVVTVASVEWDEPARWRLLTVATWTGFLMAGYALLQFLYVDQFCDQKTDYFPINRIGGTMGNRTIVAPFIAMLIPLAIYLRSWWKVAVMAAAILVCRSSVAIGAGAVAVFFQVASGGKRALRIASAVAAVLVIAAVIGYGSSAAVRREVNDSGRIAVWKLVIQDWRSPVDPQKDNSFAITGLGPGSFRYVFPGKHEQFFREHAWQDFLQAHNEYLQLLYECGVVGLFLLLGAIGWVFRRNFSFRDCWRGEADPYRMSLLSSFLCISLCALGTFVWQIAPTIFYTAVIVGLLHHQPDQGEAQPIDFTRETDFFRRLFAGIRRRFFKTAPAGGGE
jgi:hypothetical protein